MKLVGLMMFVAFGGVQSIEIDNTLENHRSDYELMGHNGGGGSVDSSFFSQPYHHVQPRPESSHHYVDMTTYQEEPSYHHRRPSYYHHHQPYHHDSFPWHWFALAKALFWKLKFLALLKFAVLAFFKIPFFLVLLGLKILFFVKLLKLAKLAITLPILLPFGLLLLIPLIPLLLAPLLLLPLLIPLLLLLPIPVLTPPTPAATTGRDNLNEETPYYSSITSLRSLLESDQCIERIACRIAPNRMTPYTAFITWALDKMLVLIRHPKLKAYVEAYKNSNIRRTGGETCTDLYRCNSLY